MKVKKKLTIPVTARLPVIQVEKLELEADRRGLSRAGLIREYLDCLLDEMSAVETIQAAAADSGRLLETLQHVRDRAGALFPEASSTSTDGG